MIQGPCLGCESRHPGCHSECEKYKDYRKALDSIKKPDDGGADDFIIRQTIKRNERWTKNSGR